MDIPIIGIGGIMNAADAMEFIIAGASAVQIGTASFINPTAAIDVVEGIESFMQEEKIERFTDLIGSLEI